MQVSASGAQVLLVASCSDAGRLPKLLRATGRLDHFIEVGTPNAAERRGMIAHMLRVRGLRFEEPVIEHVARRTEGFDSSDLAVVIERAVHQMRLGDLLARAPGAAVAQAHWDAALAGFQPAAAWEAGTKDTLDATCAPPVATQFDSLFLLC
jgi:SpoVK/Ycf46/Vps4 family AAA+-type ATPase